MTSPRSPTDSGHAPDDAIFSNPRRFTLWKRDDGQGTYGSETPVVEVTSGPGGCWLTVADDGPGLSREALARATEPFYTTRDGGMGVGLALCALIVEGHGGRLELANHPEGGGLVTCWFPDDAA